MAACGKKRRRVESAPREKSIMNDTVESVKDRMTRRLRRDFAPVALEVVDESHKHAGHILHPGGVEPRGETHFRIKVVSDAFLGKSRIDRHRLINAALADELAAGVHALAIEARAPGE